MRVVACDAETERFAPARMAPPLICVGWAWDQDPAYLQHVMDGPAQLEAAWSAAARGEVRIVGHNFAYDVAVFMAEFPQLVPLVFAAYEAGMVSDTLIRQKLLDIADGCYRGFSKGGEGGWVKYSYYLDSLSTRWLQRKLDKDNPWRVRYGELRNVPIDQWEESAVSYAVDDPAATRDVWHAQENYASKTPGVLDDEPRQVRAALALHLASVWGIRTDEEGVLALQKEAQDEIDQLKALLIECGLLRKNGTRNLKLAAEMMLAVNPSGKKTKTKRPSLDEESCLDSGDQRLIALSKFGQANNILVKDVRAMAQGTVYPIHTSFDSLMETGRTSSSRPNLQNPRRKAGVRECFVPREGKLFAACDFDKAELHTLSQVCLKVLGHSRLAERLNKNFDPHLDLGAQIMGISYEDAKARKDDPNVKEARQNAKPCNFGFPGGMGVNGFIAYAKNTYETIFEWDFANALREHWLETWPEMRDYFDWVRNLTGEVNVASIVHLYSGRRRGHIPFTVACNTFFQGLAADGAKAALWEVCRRQYTEPSSALYGTRTVNFIHDELLVEVPAHPEQAHEAAMELQEAMIGAFNPWVPDVPVRASVALMHRWSKYAEPVFNNGQLVPWTP